MLLCSFFVSHKKTSKCKHIWTEKMNPQLFIRDGLISIDLSLIYISTRNVFQNSGLSSWFLYVPKDVLPNKNQDLFFKKVYCILMWKSTRNCDFFQFTSVYKLHLSMENVIIFSFLVCLVLLVLEDPSLSLSFVSLWVAQEYEIQLLLLLTTWSQDNSW